jgi:hypothetical protein
MHYFTPDRFAVSRPSDCLIIPECFALEMDAQFAPCLFLAVTARQRRRATLLLELFLIYLPSQGVGMDNSRD